MHRNMTLSEIGIAFVLHKEKTNVSHDCNISYTCVDNAWNNSDTSTCSESLTVFLSATQTFEFGTETDR